MALLSLLLCVVGVAYADDALTAKELLGRKIYRDGNDGSGNEITAILGGDAQEPVPATMFACANCHGLEGEGKQEGGLSVPALTPQHLFSKAQPNSPAKKNYDESTLIRAISTGIDAHNKPLSATMPRYGLSAYQAQALLAYLSQLGSTKDVDVGVTGSEVQLGTVLPLTGPQAAIGKLLKATMDACIADLNSHGLIYGRKVTLTVLDSGSTKAETLATTRRLIFETKPFALISGYFPEIDADLYELLVQENLPVIAPLSFVPNESPSASASVFYFLPSYADQSRALVDYWLAQLPKDNIAAKPKLAIVYSDRASNVNVAAAIRGQLQGHNLNVIAEIVLPQTNSKPALNQATRLQAAKPEAIFFLGATQDLQEFNEIITKTDHQPVLLGLLAMLGAGVTDIPNLTMTKMLLATPFNLNQLGLKQFAAMLNQHSVNLQSPSLQRIACSAVNFVAEGLKRAGKRLSRGKFIQALAEIKKFPVDIMPPLQFDPNNRQGVRGAYILTVDTKSSSLAPQPSAWVTPSDTLHD